ncbi:phage tail sheath C-terminal domain-containing protein [Acutalibacter intestini]|uniref:phage tail sheath C-terminal domain-containing protein n=1 Tax=Acutalibacter intestini TaxID=3093659 RepID=UPI002AC93013|nr:phage tail sheath C-terminal domain-containing protein [Acutalibacter sp. M00204]
MAGGTWETQNKPLPGVYLRFRTKAGLGLSVGQRGAVTICKAMSWGPVGVMEEVEPSTDPTPFCGYGAGRPEARFIREIFKGSSRTPAPRKLLLYRPPAAGSAPASAKLAGLTVTARYPGERGNDITIAIAESPDQEGLCTVTTLVDGELQDRQQGRTPEDLKENGWVRFTGTGALASTTGTQLTGGLNGEIAASAYAGYLTQVEKSGASVMIYDGEDPVVKSAMRAFVVRMAQEAGRYCQLVASGMEQPDSQFVINVASGVVLEDGTRLTPAETCWWVGGAQAGASFHQALTYASYPGALAAETPETVKLDQGARGRFILFNEDGAVKVLQDVNSLVSFTPNNGRAFCKNRTMRLCAAIASDVYAQFSQHYLGVVDNDAQGRKLFQGAVVSYMLSLERQHGVKDFQPEDAQVLAGEESDAIVVLLGFTPVDSVEKIYVAVEVA